MLSTCCIELAVAGDVQLNPHNGRAYHHVSLTLTAGLLTDDPSVIDPDLGYRFEDGGMFEVYLDEVPGVSAADCKAVTVRMPWTDGSLADAAEKIAGKRELFDRLQRLRAGEGEPVPVVLELDPYLETTAAGGHRLTQCLAFFRQAHGAYVPHAGPLRP